MAGVAQADEPHATDAVKASYLYKFTPFIDWPLTAFETPTSPFRLCLAANRTFGDLVDQAMRDARVDDHPVVVTRLTTVAKGATCHMLFLATSQTQAPQQVLAMVAGLPTLTVVDEGVEAPEAMVRFVTIDGHVRFKIHADAAQAAGLSLSSKLLSLAVQPEDAGR